MLSSFDIANIIGAVASSAIFGCAIYIALGIRRTFSVALYRSQALGVALIALIILANNLSNVILSYFPPNIPSDFLFTNLGSIGLTTFALWFPIFYYWIDYSVLAARKSSIRDILHWQRVRVFLGPLIYVSSVILVGFSIFGNGFSYPAFVAASEGVPPIYVGIAAIILFIGLRLLGIIVLPISAWQTKDPLLRRQIYWLGLFLVLNFVGGAIFGAIGDLFEALLVYYVFLSVQAYALYRSAKSLVPMYSFSQDVIQKNQS